MTREQRQSWGRCQDPKRLRLLARIESQVPFRVEEQLAFGRRLPWIRVLDADRLLERAIRHQEEGYEAWDPFWAATWRAADGMGHYLQQLPLSGERVLEIGCGNGRAGVAAAMIGASVTFTDAATTALLVSRFHAWDWMDRCRVRHLRWPSDPTFHERFPWIVGSDIVYDPNIWVALEGCLRNYLARDGLVLLSEPQRHTGDRFLPWIRERGWQVEIDFFDLRDGGLPIRIFKCRLGSA